MEDALLSIDLGTSGLKCSIFSPDGDILAQSSAGYPIEFGKKGEAEQDPDNWYSALIECCTNMELETPGVLHSLQGAAVSGQMMGVVCIGSDGQHIGPALIHADVRAENDSEIFQWDSRGDDFDAVYAITGHRPSPAYSGSKIAWLKRHDSQRYERSSYFLQPKDFINLKLTGEIYSDYTDASGTLLFNLRERKWDKGMITRLGISQDKLPPLVPSHSLVGVVNQRASSQTGLPVGLPVAAGAGDGICAGLGAGSVEPGNAYNYIGTTAWVATTSSEPLFDPSRRIFTFAHAVEGLYHPMGTMQSAGAAVNWLREQLFSNYHSDDLAYRAIDKAIVEAEPGSDGVRFLPYLNGERSPWWRTDIRAAWTGLSIKTGVAQQARSVYEGVSGNLSMIAEILDALSPFTELSLLGGGGLSEVWPGILCDAFGKPLQLHENTVSVTARGAAVIAGVATGIYPDYGSAKKLVKIQQILKPNPAGVAVMRKIREEMEELVQRLYF